MDQTVVTRVLPNDRVAEDSVIGAMISDANAIREVEDILLPEDFYAKQNQVLYEAIMELSQAGSSVDEVTLQSKLQEKSLPAEYASQEYLSRLVMGLPVTVKAREYAKAVKECSLLRQVIAVNQNIENMCYERHDTADVILDETEKSFLALLQNRGVEDDVPISVVVQNVLNKIEKATLQEGGITGIATGFTDLDFKTAGLQPSDLILIAARPSMGKTALALNIAEHVVFNEDACTAIFSLEMSREQLVNRLLSLETSVNAEKLRNGDLTESDMDRILEGAGRIAKSKLVIDDTPSISISALRSKCRKYKQEHNLQLIIIDYLQLMTAGGRSESRQQEISEISRSLKSVARELNVPVIALSQLNRGVEQREDKRPMLSDLRDSGAIEQDADVVMFIYRDDYYNHDSPEKGISEVIIAKQRNGPLGTVKLAWLPEYTRFANAELKGRD